MPSSSTAALDRGLPPSDLDRLGGDSPREPKPELGPSALQLIAENPPEKYVATLHPNLDEAGRLRRIALLEREREKHPHVYFEKAIRCQNEAREQADVKATNADVLPRVADIKRAMGDDDGAKAAEDDLAKMLTGEITPAEASAKLSRKSASLTQASWQHVAERDRLLRKRTLRLESHRQLRGVRRALPAPRVSARESHADAHSGRGPPTDPDPDKPPGPRPWGARLANALLSKVRPARDPWAVTWSERHTPIWRLRSLRCRVHELFLGVGA